MKLTRHKQYNYTMLSRYHWPEDVCAEDGSLVASSRRLLGAGQTAYMSDELGLHRVANQSHTQRLLSLHLYSPPFGDCNVRPR